ncbi:hypothetical protein K438DRAFT_1933625 [Mycena galopus ATCC 62051]|nr:hypothetical protein K438DRAFT_1933625 [Mycena galopus ATCC 62051]
MLAEELRTRIEELSSQIELQKELLRKLEGDKRLVQRQLNAVADPVARLPLEISSEIFLQTLPSFPKVGAIHGPMLLLSICNAWTTIALSTPALWRTFRIDFPCAKNLRQVLPSWFQRAGNRSLSVSVRGDFRACDNEVCAVIWQHGEQLEHLEILNDVYDEEQDDDEYDCEGEVDLFARSGSPEPMPLLETLTIRSFIPARGFYSVDVLAILRVAPNITECFCGGHLDGGFMHLDTATSENPLVLPMLRRLMFGELEEGDDSDDQILGRLSLPALESLFLPMRTVTFEGLLGFLRRSRPPLTELGMGWEYEPESPDPVHLHECLRLVPTLTGFKMWRPELYVVADFFAALADSPSLLPSLCSLTIEMAISWDRTTIDAESSWRVLLRAVSTRRFHLRLLGVPWQAPPADVLAAFRELLADLWAATTQRRSNRSWSGHIVAFTGIMARKYGESRSDVFHYSNAIDCSKHDVNTEMNYEYLLWPRKLDCPLQPHRHLWKFITIALSSEESGEYQITLFGPSVYLDSVVNQFPERRKDIRRRHCVKNSEKTEVEAATRDHAKERPPRGKIGSIEYGTMRLQMHGQAV